jgi:sulfur carrier protein ThiS
MTAATAQPFALKITYAKRGAQPSFLDIESGTTIRHVIGRLGLNDQTFIVKLNGKIAHEDTVLSHGDRVDFVGVIYGG